MTSLLLAVLGVRILQPRRIAPFDPSTVAPPVLASDAQLPRLVVFDLDHTLWTPELYTLRHLPGYDDASPPFPVAGEDVWLLDGAEAVLHELATHERWQDDVRIAAASRTNKGNWARHLLGEFCVPGCDDRRLNELIPLQEIFPGSKLTHFERLRESTGIPYGDMIFFDDSASGRYGNCEPVAGLGVLSVHCPEGLTAERWSSALEAYSSAKASGSPLGRVLRVGGGAERGDGAARDGVVAKFFDDKRFGFVRLDGESQDVFFHANAAAAGVPLRRGAEVTVRLGKDRRGRVQCESVAPRGGAGAAAQTGPQVSMKCFSMNLPFSALLAHGRKSIETRNHTMFADTEGDIVLLHCGQRTYPDGGVHREILRRAGMSDAEIDKETRLPSGFARGQIVAAVRLGPTRLVESEAERSEPEVEAAVCATGKAMGKYLTEIAQIEWLPAPVKARGRPGLFDVDVPADALPSWAKEEPEEPGDIVFEMNFD